MAKPYSNTVGINYAKIGFFSRQNQAMTIKAEFKTGE